MGTIAQVKVFLFTDLESSTRRWEADEVGMSAALDRHDDLVRGVLADHDGHWFKHTGDGACAVFDSALSAVQAAMAIQDRLREDQMLTARIGIHLGEAQSRGDDWFGPTLNRCARLMASAHGGQTVLSGEVAASVRGQISLRDLGEHLFRDLDHPLHVFQVGDDEFPPLRTRSTSPNLPAQRSSFIGRTKELDRLDAELSSSRMITLIGVGGTGKTRLAVEAAAAAADRFSDGTLLVELAAVRDPVQVPRTIAEAVGAFDALVGIEADDADAAAEAATERLETWCAARQALLVLDNCEHVIDAAAKVADRLLAAGSGITILATSRESLLIDGEHIFPVPGLDQAAELFADRAGAVRPGFTLTDENRHLVEGLCRRLDGIPLAIELAAARLRALTLEDIAQRLDDTFRLLTGGARTSRERHATLAGALRWSYDLLTPLEQVLFRRLAVFVGGATLEAIEEVCGDDLPRDELVDLVQQLVDKSLVVFEERDGRARYRMLEIVHQYAAGLLAASGESDEVRDRHLQWVMVLTRPIATILSVNWPYCRIVDPEQENIVHAFTWAVESGRSRQAMALAISTSQYWRSLGMSTRAREWLQQALESSDDRPSFQRATASALLVGLRQIGGDYSRVEADFDRAAEMFSEVGVPLGIAYCRFGKARALEILGRADEAIATHEEAAAIFASEGDQEGAAWQIFNRAWSAVANGEREQAMALVESMPDGSSGIGSSPRASVTALLGMMKIMDGKIEAGRAMYRGALELLVNDVVEHTYASYFAAALELAYGDEQIGKILLRRSIEASRSSASFEMLGGQLAWAGVVALRRVEAERALELFEASRRFIELTGIVVPPAGDPSIVEDAEEEAALLLEASQRDVITARVASWSLSDAADAALGLLAAPEAQCS